MENFQSLGVWTTIKWVKMLKVEVQMAVENNTKK
jgi:hypothetical protein